MITIATAVLAFLAICLKNHLIINLLVSSFQYTCLLYKLAFYYMNLHLYYLERLFYYTTYIKTNKIVVLIIHHCLMTEYSYKNRLKIPILLLKIYSIVLSNILILPPHR